MPPLGNAMLALILVWLDDRVKWWNQRIDRLKKNGDADAFYEAQAGRAECKAIRSQIRKEQERLSR